MQDFNFSLQNADTDSTVQKVDKMSQESFTAAIGEVSDLPIAISSQKEALAMHVAKLDEVHSKVFGRLLMSSHDKAIVREFQVKQKEAVTIVLDQRNKSMEMFSKAGLLYSQRFIEKMLEMTGSTNEAQSAIYVKSMQNKLFSELERLSKEFMDMYEAKITDQKSRSSELQGFIEGQKKMLQERYYADYAHLLERFSKIIRTTVA